MRRAGSRRMIVPVIVPMSVAVVVAMIVAVVGAGAVGAPSALAAPAVFAGDSFTRVVANGWGTADTGGAWTIQGTASSFAVNGAAGTITLPATNAAQSARLTGATAPDTDATVRFGVDKPGTGNGEYVALIPRRVASNVEYRGRVHFTSSNAVFVSVTKLTGTPTETFVAADVAVPGLTYNAATTYRLRVTATGTNPTTIKVKVWDAAAAEPAAWALSTTDSTTALQAAGSAGVWTYLTGTTTNAPVTVTFDNLVATPPNQLPVAAFTPSCTSLACSFDATASSDPDGTITAYAWDFGDSTSGAGPTPSHSYASAGSYTVTLTVTDDSGTTATTTATVTTTGGNARPTAAFTVACGALTCFFDGSASSDPDGTIASYAWDFGDGSTGTGTKPAHGYTTGATRTVTLTVTDNGGATGTVVHTATPRAFATDTFTRTLANGWGTADGGGAWTAQGTASNFSTTGTTGRIALPAVGAAQSMRLLGASATDTDASVRFSVDKPGTGNGEYAALIVRRSAPNTEYRGRVRFTSTGAGFASITKLTGTPTETFVATDVAVTGLTYDPAATYRLRVVATGTNPTTIKVKVWNAAAPEPAAWALTATDSTASLQAAGGVGLWAYLTGTTTNAPTAYTFDDLLAAPPNQPPTASFSPSCTGLACTFDATASSDSDGAITAYAWDFGDSTSGSGPTPSHTYTDPGTYTARVMVTDDLGATATTVQTVTVAAANAPPTAAFTSNCSVLTCAFDATGSRDADGTIAGYSWTFGDGTTGSGATPSHSFPVAGSYTVTLVVADDLGLMNTAADGVTLAGPTVTLAATDPVTDTTVQNQTIVEPVTASYGNTVVVTYQAGRYASQASGAMGVGYATSTDGGRTWTSGLLPGTTTVAPVPGAYVRAVNMVVAHDDAHGVWIVTSHAYVFNGTSWVYDAVMVSRSFDGLTWDTPIFLQQGLQPDKGWITCDNQPTSPYYGRCYLIDASHAAGPGNNKILASTTTDGGATWSAPVGTTTNQQAYDVDPVVRPDGSVVVLATQTTGSKLVTFRSVDGGQTWSDPTQITTIGVHSLSSGGVSMRTTSKPAATVDAAGRVYVTWYDCRFRTACTNNDIVWIWSDDGVAWSAVQRVDVDPLASTTEHFVAGIGVTPGTSGATAQITLMFYEMNANCTPSTCLIDAVTTTSSNGGSTWAPVSRLNAVSWRAYWMAMTTLGRMVADYHTIAYVGTTPVAGLVMANPPVNGTSQGYREHLYGVALL